MRRSTWLVFSFAALVLIADQLSKGVARATLADAPIEIVPGVLRLNLVTNTGGAFGLSQATPWFFATAALLVSAWIVVQTIRGKVEGTGMAIGMGLILGGAIGNLIDRSAGGLGMSGPVTDFIDFRIWPVFNLADSAVVIGAGILAWALWQRDRERDEPSA